MFWMTWRAKSARSYLTLQPLDKGVEALISLALTRQLADTSQQVRAILRCQVHGHKLDVRATG